MNNRKCPHCGLVNFAGARECKRCAATLDPHAADLHAPRAADFGGGDFGDEYDDAPGGAKRRGLLRRAGAVLALTLALLVACHASLLLTSEGATYDQRQQVGRAVALVERGGFAREAFLLRRLTNFRTSDNWWNAYMGHADAYAATNFPFEVVTLYPEFFALPADDVERAVILLHEARHLAGDGEEAACAAVWRAKARLGWTKEQYGRTRVWRNVGELTRRHAPGFFTCGEDGRQDCFE
ncbi:MAG TPA: hypothetical protein VF668_01950 [Pyrinomonadaceae bacterium]|jgi:hypothetical protein